MVNNPAPGMVPAGQMAKLLDLTPERLRQLARDGVFPRAIRGRYGLVATVQGYLQWLADPDRRAAQSRPGASLATARTREIELRLAERTADIIDADDVVGFHEYQSRVHRDELAGLGASINRDPIIAGQIDAKIAAALGRFDGRFDEAISKLRAGLDPLDHSDA